MILPLAGNVSKTPYRVSGNSTRKGFRLKIRHIDIPDKTAVFLTENHSDEDYLIKENRIIKIFLEIIWNDISMKLNW